MRWVAIAVGAILIVTLVGIQVLRPLRSNLGVPLEKEAHGFQVVVGQDPNYAELFFPGSAQELDEVRDFAAATCARQDVEQLSAALGTSRSPHAVAERYAERIPLQQPTVRAAIYDGCLEGFKSQA